MIILEIKRTNSGIEKLISETKWTKFGNQKFIFLKSNGQIFEVKTEYFRNQTNKLCKSQNHFRNQTDKFWQSKKSL